MTTCKAIRINKLNSALLIGGGKDKRSYSVSTILLAADREVDHVAALEKPFPIHFSQLQSIPSVCGFQLYYVGEDCTSVLWSRSVFFSFFLNWSIVVLQCWVSFCCAAKCNSYTYILSFFGFPSHLCHHRALSRLHCATQ